MDGLGITLCQKSRTIPRIWDGIVTIVNVTHVSVEEALLLVSNVDVYDV